MALIRFRASTAITCISFDHGHGNPARVICLSRTPTISKPDNSRLPSAEAEVLVKRRRTIEHARNAHKPGTSTANPASPLWAATSATSGTERTCEIKKLDHGYLYVGLDISKGGTSIHDFFNIVRFNVGRVVRHAVRAGNGMTVRLRLARRHVVGYNAKNRSFPSRTESSLWRMQNSRGKVLGQPAGREAIRFSRH